MLLIGRAGRVPVLPGVIAYHAGNKSLRPARLGCLLGDGAALLLFQEADPG